MSEQYPGGWITKSPPAPTEPYNNSTAPGIWNLTQQAQYRVQGIWPTQGNNPPIYWIATVTPPSTGGFTGIGSNGGTGTTDSSGNFYINLNYTPSSGPYYAAYANTKFSINGKITFSYAYTWTGGDTGSLGNPVLDSSGNIFLSGNTGTSPAYAFYSKANSSGASQWAYQSVAVDHYLTTVAGIDSSGNIYWAGQDPNLYGLWVKTNSSGSVTATRVIQNGTHNYSYFSQAFVDSSGTFYGCGSTIYDGFYAKITNTGTVSVYTSLGTSYGGSLASMAIDTSYAYFYCIAYSPSTGPVFNLWKMSTADGISNPWVKQSSGLYPYGGYVTTDSSNNVYVFTRDNSNGLIGVILKFNSSGTLQWQRSLTYSGTGNVGPSNITVDSTNSAFIIGASITGAMVFFRLPTDGSQTGTYGSWTYAASSYTFGSGSGTWAGDSHTDTTWTTSATTSSVTLTAQTFPDTVTKIA